MSENQNDDNKVDLKRRETLSCGGFAKNILKSSSIRGIPCIFIILILKIYLEEFIYILKSSSEDYSVFIIEKYSNRLNL
jgi:hypothetical protein